MIKSVAFFESYYIFAETLAPEIRLRFYETLMKYAFRNEYPPINDPVYAVFALVKPTLDKTMKTYANAQNGGRSKSAAKIAAARENGKKGGRPKNGTPSVEQGENETEIESVGLEKEGGKPNETQAEKPNETQRIRIKDKDKDKEKNKNKKKEGGTLSHPPIPPLGSETNAVDENLVDGSTEGTPCRSTPPTLDQVLVWAADAVQKPDGKPIPEKFAREWFALMSVANPPWTNTRGFSIVGDWRRHMSWAWKNEKQWFAANRARNGNGAMQSRVNQPDGVVHHQEGYENPL